MSAWLPIHTRRDLLRYASAALVLSAMPSRLLRASDFRFKTTPFTLGVASGYPVADGVVLWTRLHSAEIAPDMAVPVEVEIATDERLRSIVHRSTHHATAEWGHSIHAEIAGLKADREYWYRFTTGDQRSVVGKTRTAPAANQRVRNLRVAVASCQKYENGYFVAYRHMVKDDVDLVVHTGDYIYEYESAGRDAVRSDGSSETYTLADYRARYALYKSDPDLQAMHAACPWLVTWDDHEVTNDYAGETTYGASGEAVLVRRAAAYRAYYENMPLRRSAVPNGPHMQLHAGATYGRLLEISMLDSRQHRSPLGCRGAEDDGGPGARCASLFDAARTKLGKQQEEWLSGRLAKTRARWNVLAQGTPMAHVDNDSGEGVAYRRDSWDGYPAARQRVLDALVDHKVDNPIVIDGDIHAFQIANLNRKANDLSSPVIASEFTTNSITSGGGGRNRFEQLRRNNPNVLFGYNEQRGYLTLDFAAKEVRAKLMTVETIRSQDAGRNQVASFVVENGKPGPVRV